MNVLKNKNTRNAIMLGGLCSVSYLAVYIARNILGVVSPQMIEIDGFTEEYIGTLSSLYFIFYGVGQLINGAIGEKIKAKYMISLGLILAGICNACFPYVTDWPKLAQIIYAMTGFFLSMIYAPLTKVVAENTEPVYAVRCTMGFTFASFFGSPLAGVLAALFLWQMVFSVSSVVLVFMGIASFVIFSVMERHGVVRYNRYDSGKKQIKGGGIGILIKHKIIKFTLISILTGIVRTTVIFWLPTYLTQYLGYSTEISATIFTVATFIISSISFIAIFIYERLNHNMDLAILLGFSLAAICFMGVFLVKVPTINVILLVLAIMSSGICGTMLWSRYCPGLRDTGMVSSATGFLDFVSYMAAAASSSIFANAVSVIGWEKLILVWFGLMVVGVIIALPRRQISGGIR